MNQQHYIRLKLLTIAAALAAITVLVGVSHTLDPIRRYHPLLGTTPEHVLSVLGPPKFDTRALPQDTPTPFILGYEFSWYGQYEFHFENNKLSRIATGPNK